MNYIFYIFLYEILLFVSFNFIYVYIYFVFVNVSGSAWVVLLRKICNFKIYLLRVILIIFITKMEIVYRLLYLKYYTCNGNYIWKRE